MTYQELVQVIEDIKEESVAKQYRMASSSEIAAAIIERFPECEDPTPRADCIDKPGHDRLWGWFSLSYASFCVVPRIMMHAMSDKWQWHMARLLEEYETAFPGLTKLPMPYVSARSAKNLWTAWPEWLLHYRHPNTDIIESMRKHDHG